MILARCPLAPAHLRALKQLSTCRRHVAGRGRALTTVQAASRSLFDRNLFRWPLRSQTVAEAETEVADPAAAAFTALTEEGHASGSVGLRQSAHNRGRGLYVKEEVDAAGATLLAVPLDVCLVIDYAKGVRLPPAEWPRLKKGVAKDDALPWDVLQALALLDALAGDGGDFWGRYANEVLPEPLALSLPMCLPERLLRQLGHDAVIQGALAQKQRLAGLFPGLARPMCEDGPTYLEWALACVRSRAFQLGPECFAFVPFLDVANHAAEPNADFRLSADGGEVQLQALAPIAANAEVTISYTGSGGQHTNQRLMAQYGFVPRQGNPNDRLEFACLAGEREPPQNGAEAERQEPASGVLLSLDALQMALGDGEEMMAAFSGRDPYLYSAIKSLPLASMESDAAPLQVQVDLAEQLLGEVEGEMERWASTLEEDEAELVLAADSAALGGDGRLAAVVRYRVERKRLVAAEQRVLRSFLHK